MNDFLDASIQKVVNYFDRSLYSSVPCCFLIPAGFSVNPDSGNCCAGSYYRNVFLSGLFGFTINLLTLFALLLAIGIVVDDAIVVVEAVHAKLDQGYKSALKASRDAMSEITGAIISITLVMAAVFLPVTFIGGSAGVFYKQFGITLAIAIILSAINALTLSPALCAIFLKPHKDEKGKKLSLIKRFYASFNTGFEATTYRYKKAVGFLFTKALDCLVGHYSIWWPVLFFIKNNPVHICAG